MGKVFLSYSRADSLDFARELRRRFVRDGIDCFFDETSIDWGDHFVLSLEKGLDECEYIVVVLTPGFVNSKWTDVERTSIMLEDPTNLKRKIRPLLYRPCEIPRFLKALQYLDVTTLELFDAQYSKICHDLGGILQPNTPETDLNTTKLTPFMSSTVFVSYRRDDAASEANSIAKLLSDRLGKENVFFDTSSIVAGQSWPDSLNTALIEAKTIIVVIGPEWVKTADEWGRRRIDDPKDWVRREIETALELNKSLIPVLVDGASIPPEHVLPDSLKKIMSKQAIEVRRDYFDHDVKLLLAQFHKIDTTTVDTYAQRDSSTTSPCVAPELPKVLEPDDPGLPPPRSSQNLHWIAAGLAIALLVFLYVFWQQREPNGTIEDLSDRNKSQEAFDEAVIKFKKTFEIHDSGDSQ